MRELKQSQAANVIIFMADSTDHITGKTGLTLTVTLSKDGGVFASITPTVTERTSGWYNIALTSLHTDTLGDCVVRATSAGADASERALNVVANVEADTYARVGAPAGISVSADVAAVKGDTAAILADTGTDGVVVATASKTGYAISGTKTTLDALNDVTAAAVRVEMDANSADLNTIIAYVDELEGRLTVQRAGYLDNLNTGVPLSAAAVDSILDEVVEGTLTLRQMMRIMLASLAGKSSGGGSATLLFKGADGATTRITATVDADGNRTAITVNGA